MTDAGLEHLKGFTNIRWLSIDNTKITDAGLENLHTNLLVLNLRNTQITDAGLERVKGFTNLRRLILLETQVTDEGVNKLQQALPNCEIRH